MFPPESVERARPWVRRLEAREAPRPARLALGSVVLGKGAVKVARCAVQLGADVVHH